ncbi:CLUMA_CG016204, isoform D [Clunio marinus]|uniref:CLUMA_CG016204, isoform D n=1 Tax=Clunio marinus TaxID=568069 RepID=A0A1J1IUQ8_9DIPT|nr:CLUMA_CG016204, isoform D [Clunio marinus]
MSGDIQTRQRRKEKRKQKRDEPAIGVDTTKIKESEKKDVQMHIHDQHDHGVGWCAKIVFFSLMAILAGLVVLIVLENRGQSDVDTPLSESRFSEYLQGWVDETREEEHHDEVHFTPPDDDEHDDDGHETTAIPDDEPYPEEKDYSTPEENNESEELNAEINADESTQDEQSDNQEDDDDDDETVEANETPSNNDDEDEVETRGDQQPEEVDDKEDEVPNMFEDSTPFEEEDNDDDFEDVIDNDVGEDLLLQKLAEQSEAAAAQADENQEETDEAEAEGSSSQIPKEGGEKSYLDQLLEDQVRMDNSEEIEEMLLEAKITDARAEKEQSNKRLMEAIELYKDLLITHGDKLNASIFKEVAERCIERMRFIGKFKAAVKIHRLLIERFSDEPNYPNQLAVTYLLGNHLSEAKLILHEILMRWRFNGFALVHYGFVLKNLDKDYENAALYIKEGIDSNEPGTQDGRFYFNLGDALQRLGKNDEAREVYKKGAKIGLFLSEHQRSLYNVDHLKSTPFWTKVQTTYKDDLMEIQKYWQLIRDEGLKLLSEDGRFSNEAENLKDTGDWKQFELFARGRKTKHCMLAPITCQIIENFDAAATCKRGQVKFSVLHPKTHIHSHTGPTNCRVRCHLGLKVPEKTFLRVADETRSWKDGEWLIFDDSFEHEVWHNGTGLRLVLIVDVWHPQLTDLEKQSMSPI